MFERDLLVAFIAFALGFALISSAVLNYERAFEIRTPKYLSQTLGRGRARMIMGLIGAFVVLIGIYIISAPFINKSPNEEHTGSTYPPSMNSFSSP